MPNPGYLWIEGTELHWTDESGTEHFHEGTLESSGVGTAGYFWVEASDDTLHYIDKNGDERKCGSQVVGSPGASEGYIWVEGTDLHWIDTAGDDRVIY